MVFKGFEVFKMISLKEAIIGLFFCLFPYSALLST
jgi:hypothetical protein